MKPRKNPRRACWLFSLLMGAMVAWWFIPMGKTEKEFQENAHWDLCDYKFRAERLNAIRFENRFAPFFKLARKRTERSAKAAGTLHFVRPRGMISGNDIPSWKELEFPWAAGLSIYPWLNFENEVNQLLSWDRNRSRYRFGGSPKLFFLPQPGLTRTGPAEFELELDSGELEASRADIAKVIESYWSTKPYRLKIRWLKGNPQIFRFELNPSSFFSRVTYREKRIYLNPVLTPGLLAHEIGHVLGFDDAYSLTWNGKECRMQHAAQLRDLMANSNYHRALRGHWRVLEKAYARSPANRAKPFEYSGEEILFADQDP